MSSASVKRQRSINKGSASAPHPMVLQAQAKANELLAYLQKFAMEQVERAKARPVQEHGITVLSSFLLAVTLRWLTMHKGDHLVTFALIVNVLLFSLVTTVIQSHTAWVQYSNTVVFFSVMHALHLVHSSPLVLAAVPLLIDQIKIYIVKTAQKVDLKQ